MKNKIIPATIVVLLAIIGITVFLFVNNQKNGDNTQQSQPSGNSFASVWGKNKVFVGLDEAFPPMTYRDENGEIVGVDVDLAKEVFNRIGIEAEFKPVEWDSIILTLETGDIDLIWSGLTITDERKEKIDFSIPYVKSENIFIVNINSGLRKKSDLQNKVIGVQAGSSQDTLLNDESSFYKEIKGFSTVGEAILDLEAGRVDAVCADDFSTLYYIQKTLNKSDKFESFSAEGESTFMGIGIRKEDSALKEEINRVFKEIIEDGTAGSISMDWLGKDLIVKE